MNILAKYAQLLIDYCLEIRPGEKLYIRTTTEAIPLVREVYRYGIRQGAHIEVDLSWDGMVPTFMAEANDNQLNYLPTLQKEAMTNFDAYLAIKAPSNLRETQNIDSIKRKKRQLALSEINDLYFSRTASGSLKRSLCLYPTNASAQEAGMSLEEYAHFVYNACRLYSDDPASEWLAVRKKQQYLTDFLNQAKQIRYTNPKTDITFSTEGRTWINSDGRANMPSGEVFTGPVEESVNGVVHFDYPSIFMGQEVSGITLEVKNGLVEKWQAEVGKDVLDTVFGIEGARYFGEVAIGTNYHIQQATKNILFDEKIGGTIHMAVGQSYAQSGGKNQSTIHWDMIANMQEDATITVDGEVIYRDGKFITGLL